MTMRTGRTSLLLAAAFAVAAHCLIWPSPSHAAPQKRAEITIAGFTDTGSLANFPVLVRLSPTRVPGFSYADCAPGGADIAFEDANGAPLDREIDTWDPAGESLVWVRIPSFASNGVFRLTYKDPSVTVQPPCQTNGAVWQASTYVGVWHFGEKCGTAADSTTNALHGAVNAAHDETCVAADAMAGKGRYFPAAATVDLPNFSHLNIGNTLSFSGWFKYDPRVAIASSTSPMLFYGKTVWNSTADGWYVALQWSSNSDTTKKTIGVNGAGTSAKNTTIDSIKSAWVHVAVVFSNTKAYVYSNGILKGTPSITAAKNLAASVTPRFFQSNYTGFADEVRICDAANSAAWIKAEYQTVADKAFLGYGAVETIAPAGGYISVTGDPASYRENNLPDYAFLGNPATGTYAYQAPACVYLDAARTRRAVCTGWKLLDDAGATLRSSADSGESPLSCTIDFTAGDRRRLVWLWREELHVAVTADAGLTVSATPEWVAAGGTTTLSVTDDGASFTHWSGSVDARDARSPSYTVTVNVPKTIHANAATTIRYVAPGGTGDGTSWGSAYGDVRTALLAVSNLTSGASLICVKEGFYNVTNAAAIKMLSPVTVRGGYSGVGLARDGETVLARTNGAPQMAILSFTASNLALESLTISNGWSQASYWGQGVALENGCTATIRDCRFDRNGSAGNLTDKGFYGGAIGAQNGTLSIDGCDFTLNSLHAGGGNVSPLGGAVGASGARVRISNSTFDRNYVQMVHARPGGGGALGFSGSPSVEIDHCTFTTNYARRATGTGAYPAADQRNNGPYGGTIYITGSASATISHCTFVGGWNNSVAYDYMTHNWGGLMAFRGSHVAMARCAILGAGWSGYTSGDCFKYASGSISLCGGSLHMTNVLHGAAYSGPALANYAYDTNSGGVIEAVNCTFAGGQGKGSQHTQAYVQSSGSASFRNCIFWGNAGGDFLVVAGENPTFEYCVTDELREGFGNKVYDPLFGDSTYFHPVSRAGRYAGGFFAGGSWTIDEATSSTIDAGDPALDWGDEPQPNLRRLNLGYDGGTASASKSDCTENPVVDETALQIFAYAADATTEAAVLSADVASLGGGTNAVVTLVWGDEDHGADLAAWGANAVTFPGSHGEWELLSHTLPNPPRGTTYYRFRAENDTGVAWSAPARTFVLSSPPSLAYDTPENPVSLLRHTGARLNATLVDDCGMDTTAYALYWPAGDEASAVRVDLNFGDPVPEGPLDFDLSGLAPGTTYAYFVAAANGMGETRLATNAFTAVAASTPLVRYVAPESSGLGDGSSFANATSNLQWAVDFTELAGDEIRLVAGTNTLADTVGVANHPGLVIRGGYTADDERGGWSCLRRDASQSRKYRILHASASALLVDSVEFADGAYETPGTYYGQAVSLMSACTATFTNCLFRDNGVAALTEHSNNNGFTSQYGGALGASGGALTIVDCAFRNNRIWGGNYNTQPYGGAIAAYNADVSILRSAFDANCTQTTHSRVGGGGAIFLHTCRNANIAECQFTTNYCRTGGGTYAHGNTQTGPFGGTLWLYNTTANVTDCDIAGGWLSNGTQGGIYYGVGGVAFVSGASADVTFDRVRVHDCGFTGQGNATSAINKQTQNDFCAASGKLTVKNGLFTRAYGSTQFSNRGGVLDVVNCTVTGGRGLATSRSQQTFVHTSGTTTLRNLIVWDNSGDALYAADGSTAPTVVCCDLEAADPLFKDAASGDYHLKADSPCRDAGDTTGFTRDDLDLDHDRRVRGAIDLGCFEGSIPGLFLIMQ